MKRFLWGVDGVMLAGGRFDTCDGGVWERVFSLIPLPRPSKGSGDNDSRSACGTVLPNSSLRRTREYILFASSAGKDFSQSFIS